LEEVGKEIDEIVAKKFSNASIRVAAARESAKPKSAFIGTSRNGSKWKARRGFKGTQYPFGTYVLEADAAFAYDCAVEGLWDNNGIMNFETKRDYFNARKLELESKGISADESESLNEVVSQINRYCRRLPAAFNYVQQSKCCLQCYNFFAMYK
jgi:hypothetical protein